MFRTSLPLAFVTLTAILVAGCASAPSGGDPTPTPFTLTATVSGIKTITFAWTTVDDATEYQLNEATDGSNVFTPIATLPATSTTYDHEIFLPDRSNARYTLTACTAEGCTDTSIVTIDTLIPSLIGYVKASNTGELDRFGYAVALSTDGTTLAVGAQLESSSATGVDGPQGNDDAAESGAVYVYRRDHSGVWQQEAYVKASNTGAFDGFGSSVALSGDGTRLIVAAPSEDSTATGVNGLENDDGASESGAVYVFTRDPSGTWQQEAYVKATNAAASDDFGWSVDLSNDGNTLAVGAIREDSNAVGIDDDPLNDDAENSGAVYVYTRDELGIWQQQAYVKASNTGAGDQFGWSVALAGDGATLAVGARIEDSGAVGIDGDQLGNGVTNSGAVYVYTRDELGTWQQQAYVKASNTGFRDFFGHAVALSDDGDTLAVGALLEDSDATGIDGPQDDDASDNVNSGAVYVYTRDPNGTWQQEAYVKASNTGVGDFFGHSVALSGDGATLAVGALLEDGAAAGIDGAQDDDGASNSGAVYVYTRDELGSWQPTAYVKASNPDASDEFGHAVAVSGNGTTLAVGTYREDSGATGIDGAQNDETALDSGAVYLY